jgi:hypothetical protein
MAIIYQPSPSLSKGRTLERQLHRFYEKYKTDDNSVDFD